VTALRRRSGLRRSFGRGYADVSIDDVLAQTDVSRGALYNHFLGKEALFLAVFEAMEARIARETVARAGDGTRRSAR
jgi:AcrR family transcriptional regulator